METTSPFEIIMLLCILAILFCLTVIGFLMMVPPITRFVNWLKNEAKDLVKTLKYFSL